MAIYYHVSTDITHNGEFIPRVPSFRHGDSEDSTTARVCVSTSIEGCLSAIPNGGSGLDYLRMEQRGYFQVFKIDTDKLGIGESDVVLSEELYEKDSVRDANFTDEVWITTPFIVPMEDRELMLFLILFINWLKKNMKGITFVVMKRRLILMCLPVS